MVSLGTFVVVTIVALPTEGVDRNPFLPPGVGALLGRPPHGGRG